MLFVLFILNMVFINNLNLEHCLKKKINFLNISLKSFYTWKPVIKKKSYFFFLGIKPFTFKKPFKKKVIVLKWNFFIQLK